MKRELEELLLRTKSNQERLILNVLIEHFEQIPDMKLEDIAKLAYCSKTSVVRVLTKLGYKGFIDYQFHINMEMVMLLNNNRRSLEFIKKSLNEIEKFVDFINSKEHIVIYGHGPSSIVAQYLFRQLIEKGKSVTYINDIDLLHNLSNEAVIIIASGAKNIVIEALLKELQTTKKCSVALITKRNSQLLKHADIVLEHEDQYSTSSNDPIDSLVLINQVIQMID